MRLIEMPLYPLAGIRSGRIFVNPECVATIESKLYRGDKTPFCELVLNDGRILYVDNDAVMVSHAVMCDDVYRVEALTKDRL